MHNTDLPARVAQYTRMDQGTHEDYAVLDELARPYIASTAELVPVHLESLAGGLQGNLIDRYQHSLQTATPALRANECEEIVVAALLHGVGDVLAPENHDAMSAAILTPYVCKHTHRMVLHHGVFQGYDYFDKIGADPNARERHRGHPAFEMTERSCYEYDQQSFDPNYATLPIDAFLPMVERLFARKPLGAHTEAESPGLDA